MNRCAGWGVGRRDLNPDGIRKLDSGFIIAHNGEVWILFEIYQEYIQGFYQGTV